MTILFLAGRPRRVVALAPLAAGLALLGPLAIPASAATSTLVQAVGNSYSGQLGNGTSGSTTPQQTPVSVSSLTSVIAVSAGSEFSVALKSDNTVWTWGRNDRGQLGNSSFTLSSTPVQVAGVGGVGTLSGVTAISAGNEHVLARKSDGTVVAWGSNTQGQLGNNSYVDSSFPVSVLNVAGTGPLGSISSVAAGGWHSIALTTGGSVVDWGWDYDGQLGDGPSGPNTSSPYAVQVNSLNSNVASIGAGGLHSLAVKTNGTAYAWGLNTQGQLGKGTTTNTFTPSLVTTPGGVTWSKLVGGYRNTAGLTTVGAVYAWGSDDAGQVCNGATTTAAQTTPVITSLTTGVAKISAGAGGLHLMALLTNGTANACGNNDTGQLGNVDKPLTFQTAFVPVIASSGGSAITGIDDVAAGGLHSVFGT